MKNSIKTLSLLASVALSLAATDTNTLTPLRPSRKLQLCFISMNNPEEFKMAEKFIKKIQSDIGQQGSIEVVELLEENDDPSSKVQEKIQRGQYCDGLVISGHHTGAFGGQRASGSLDINKFEELSCKNGYQGWFDNIKSLWLQGCRTLGAGHETQGAGQNLAEFHAQRVAQVREADGLDQTRSQLADEFASVLDVETPYASRYFQVFPNSYIYGWTATAPGEMAESERSLLLHTSNVARLMLKSQNINISKLQSPLSESLNSFSSTAYFNALVTMLSGDAKNASAVVGGWLDHGGENKPAEKIFALENSDLNAYPPIQISNDPTMAQGRKNNCALQNAKNRPDLKSALTEISRTEQSISQSFYTLMHKFHQARGRSHQQQIYQEVLGASPAFTTFLEKKLSNTHIPISRKLDFAGLYRDILGRAHVIEPKLLTQAEQTLMKKAERHDYDARDEKETVLSALLRNELIGLPKLQVWTKRGDWAFFMGLAKAMAYDEESGETPIDFNIGPIVRHLVSLNANNPTLVDESMQHEVNSELIYAITELPLRQIDYEWVISAMAAHAKKYDASENGGTGMQTFLVGLSETERPYRGLQTLIRNTLDDIKSGQEFNEVTEENNTVVYGSKDVLIEGLSELLGSNSLKIPKRSAYLQELLVAANINGNIEKRKYMLTNLMAALESYPEPALPAAADDIIAAYLKNENSNKDDSLYSAYESGYYGAFLKSSKFRDMASRRLENVADGMNEYTAFMTLYNLSGIGNSLRSLWTGQSSLNLLGDGQFMKLFEKTGNGQLAELQFIFYPELLRRNKMTLDQAINEINSLNDDQMQMGGFLYLALSKESKAYHAQVIQYARTKGYAESDAILVAAFIESKNTLDPQVALQSWQQVIELLNKVDMTAEALGTALAYVLTYAPDAQQRDTYSKLIFDNPDFNQESIEIALASIYEILGSANTVDSEILIELVNSEKSSYKIKADFEKLVLTSGDLPPEAAKALAARIQW